MLIVTDRQKLQEMLLELYIILEETELLGQQRQRKGRIYIPVPKNWAMNDLDKRFSLT